jgi:hypothetical protein
MENCVSIEALEVEALLAVRAADLATMSTLIQALRSHDTSLREFCRSCRHQFGAEVLVGVVRNLQRGSHENKVSHAQAVAASQAAGEALGAFRMALHPRLGANSSARHLAPELVERIGQCLVPHLSSLELTVRLSCRRALQGTPPKVTTDQEPFEASVRVRVRDDAPFGLATPLVTTLCRRVALEASVVYEDGSPLTGAADAPPPLIGNVRGIECSCDGSPVRLRLRTGLQVLSRLHAGRSFRLRVALQDADLRARFAHLTALSDEPLQLVEALPTVDVE